jgi:hypothetical protein
MGSTKCYDILIVQAKNKKLKSKTEPPEIDQELQSKVDAEKEKYESQADKIYGAECGIIDAKYKAKTLAVDAKKEIWKQQYKLERFNSTDEEKYTETGVKTTVQKELEKLMSTDEEYQKKLAEKREEAKQKREEQAEKKAKKQQEKEASESKKRREEKKKKRQEKKEKEKERQSTIKNDLIAAASEIGKGTDKDIDDYESKQLEAYNAYARDVEERAKAYGEEKGAEMVQEYNTKIRKTAKNKFEKNKDKLAKAQVKIEQGKQTVLLKIAALLGL